MTSNETHIPLFPLNTFLLPGEKMPLHIFEPRYKQLFDEAKAEGYTFGLPFDVKGTTLTLVSQCKLLRVTRNYRSGESDVIVEAIGIAELVKFERTFPGKMYPGGLIKERTDFNLNRPVSNGLISLFKEFIAIKNNLDSATDLAVDNRLSYIASELNMDNSDKIKLLMTPSHEQREKILINNIRYLNLLFVQENSVEKGLILN